jgi:acetyl esterase/lipase
MSDNRYYVNNETKLNLSILRTLPACPSLLGSAHLIPFHTSFRWFLCWTMLSARHPALAIILVISSLSRAQVMPATTPKREHFQNAEVIYAWVQDGRGNRLRTFVTRPNRAVGKVPAIFFVGWLSCDSVEYPNGETDGFGAIFHRLIEQSGYATLRLDKPGVGESQGDCAQTDFTTELSGYQAAFDAMFKYGFIDPANVFVVGLSNGGGTSALVPASIRYADTSRPVRGAAPGTSTCLKWNACD